MCSSDLITIALKNEPEIIGVSFMITDPAKAAANPKITLALKNVTLEEATERVAKAAGVKVTAEDFAFVFFRFKPMQE